MNWRIFRWNSLKQGINTILRTGILSLIILSGFACSKEEVEPDDKTQTTEEQPVQYDQPFLKVPNASDVVMYEVNLSAFSAEGNLKGVTDRLDNLKELGINVVWLMPIYPRGELKGVGSPYAVKNYTAVNPSFGNLEDLRKLVKEAHSRDMAVILDWVANHTAWDNPWIQNTSWYTKNSSGQIISPEGTGWNDVADLNFSSQAMKKEMIKAMKYWVLEANVDGYRCDYAEGVPTDFWKQAIDTLRDIPNRKILMFAEAGKKELFSAGFDLIFGWNFYDKLKEVYNQNASTANLVSANSTDYTNVPEGSHILRWITNHDDGAWDDTPVNIFKGQQGALSAFVISAYMGGVPLIYTGQEVGFSSKIGFFTNTETKIDWTINPSIFQEYKKLMAFRSNSSAVRGGSLEAMNTPDVMAFKRSASNEEVLVIVNVRNSATDFVLPASVSNSTWTNGMSSESETLNTSLSLEPYEYKIFRK